MYIFLFIGFLFIDNNNSSCDEHEKENLVPQNANSSTTTITNSEESNRAVLNAITVAIDNHMRPSITPTNKRKKQIDRPYGESITSVDAYMKIKAKENSRKRKSTKENDVKNEKIKPKQTKG